ncbi:hypothetical protein PHYPSEUDO_001613 [Phytophthora pseudosyringae]|uniref:HECT E3 ubiquitin ligase n=1 Tax=Phytophthora pseudosyringae TaxID=221518 RepID=A0A8T1VVQ1_9STRA|nr:hypothetical protein PHYPSEUDO_001613 [Phytophthora pseudosyringae]
MEALLLQDGAYVRERYAELQDARRQLDHDRTTESVGGAAGADCSSTSELSVEELEHWRIAQRAKALDAKGPTPPLRKKFTVLQDVMETLYAENEADLAITSPRNGAAKRLEMGEVTHPVPLKELPVPTQAVLKMFFRTCQSLRDPTKLAANSRLSVQIATKLPTILTTMPSCVLSPGLADDVPAELENEGDAWSVFYQLFQLFEELLGVKSDATADAVCLSVSDRATVIVAYVALSLKWGRLGYLLKGVKLLLENANELHGTRFKPLLPLCRELAATSAEQLQAAFSEEEQTCGYLMSFGKGDHGKLGHGQCAHVSCQEGNCTENKMAPTLIASTRDVLFRKIDSLSTHSIAITAKGEAMAWGNGDKYRLGHGSSTKEYTPRTIEFLSLKGRVRDLACGLGHTLALTESGDLFAWGNGSNGRLGLGDTNDRSSPTRVVIPTTSQGKEAAKGGDESVSTTTPVRFRHIFCGASHSLGLSWDGIAYAWGKNNQGQCGHGHTNDQWTIQQIESFRDNEDGEGEECITYAAGGWEHTLFCGSSGRVYSCGCGYKDSRRAGIPPVLGHGDCDRRLKPTLVQALDDAREEIVKVACGWDHSLVVSASGKVFTWGSGTNGKLGHGDEESFDIPTLVRSMEGKRVKDAKAGCEHTVFLSYDHELWTCGQGDSGRLGHGDSQTRKRPTKIELFAECGLKPVALAVGDKYNLVLVRDSDAQLENEGPSETASIQKPPQRISGGHASVRHRTGQHKKHHDSNEMQFTANWVLGITVGIEPEGSPTTKPALRDPDSASSVALFIAGHVDRLASDYISDESEIHADKGQERKATETNSKAQKLVLLPYATDTSQESLYALLQLLQWTTCPVGTKEKAAQSEKSSSDVPSGMCLGAQERMGLALSCLRILQLNLKKSLDVLYSPVQSVGENLSDVPIDLFGRIHELLDSLAGLKGEDYADRFGNGNGRSDGTNNICAVGSAISHEAACALKMGFGMFYPTGTSRCNLLWEILDDCKVCSPSMRTIILSDQLCKDSIMTEIFRCLPSHGLLSLQNDLPDGIHNESSSGKDIFDIKTLMIVLLKRSSADAIKHLDNESFTDFMNEPDCFLRLLNVLQMHYFSIAHQSAIGECQMNGTGHSKDARQIQSHASDRMMDSLLDYVDALMAESLSVLKRLHKGSRQHEEIITWRLNGSFFHTLLPRAIECLSVLLLPVPNRENVSKAFKVQTTDNLLLVERILPNLHVMLKMLDEVSWKMHSITDAGNQAHDDSTLPSHQLGFTDQERNWFVNLGDVCAVLCGKLSCELFYPSRMSNIASDDSTLHGTYYSLVLSEGRCLREDYGVVPATRAGLSSSIRNILEWERLGVFEVEDELVGGKEDSNATDSLQSLAFENQRFLLQLCDADFSSKPLSFWSWIAERLSYTVESTIEVQRLLVLVVSVFSWHLGLSAELRSLYALYDTASQNDDSVVPTGGIWTVLSILTRVIKTGSSAYRSIDSEAVENATKASRLLLSLQPNHALMPCIFRDEGGTQHTDSLWEYTDDSFLDMLGFLTRPLDLDIIQRSLDMKEEDGALLRTGICILHDLLRKLTTSSTKSCLLAEFVAVTCVTNRATLTPVVSRQKSILSRENGKQIDKAIENLFVRLTRVVACEDASFELKKKALMAWTVPLSATKRGVPSVVALIAKSGIMNTLVELLLDEANVLDAHSDINAVRQPMTAANQDEKWGSVPQPESRLPTKVSPAKALLFDETPAQIISVLAWEAFCAITMQLSKSEHFGEHRSNLLFCSAGSSLHEREPLTPRSTSMSPRRRLTLPKKTVISSIDEIIEQMTDGLFLMLKGTKSRLDILAISSQEYGTLVRPVEKTSKNPEKVAQKHQHCSRAFLFGCPAPISHSNSCDIGMPNSTDIEGTTCTTLALIFWIYVEHTGAMLSEEIPSEVNASSANPRSKDSSVRLVTFGSSRSTKSMSESTDVDRDDASLTVFTRDACPDHISIGLSMKCGGDSNESWSAILVDEHLPRGKWVQVVASFDKERSEQVQVFVGARRSTLNNGKLSVDHCRSFCLEFLQKATLWTQMTAGGNVDMGALTNAVKDTSTPELLRLSVLRKKLVHRFAAVVDDIVIARGELSEEMIIRMQHNGPVLFRLKQQHIAETHCVKVLRLLCQLVGSGEECPPEDLLPARLPSSDRWITLFTRMLLSTCRGQDLAQVYLCYLLQDVLPRALPPPDFDVQSLGQQLFGTSLVKTTQMEELFVALNDSRHLLPSNSTIRRQNGSLYRMMQQHGMLNGKYRGGGLSDSDRQSDETARIVKPTASMRFAAAVHLFQKLCGSPSWGSRMDQFVGSSSAVFQSGGGGLKEIIQSEEIGALELADMTAVVSTLAGYSEEVVNGHRASVQEAANLPSAAQAYTSPFDSVMHFDSSNTGQVETIQTLIATMLKDETRRALSLPDRKAILAQCHNDVVTVNAVDLRIGAVVHQRARVLRVLMTAVLREKYTATTNNRWHQFLLDDTAACDDLLQVASSNAKEYVTSVLGPDAKLAMKLRLLRIFIKEVLRGGKHRRSAIVPVSLADLEGLQWRLWEKMATQLPSDSLIPWWQHSSEANGKLMLEVVGGNVELRDLNVKALEHFPTVRLAQANICANSGLWFFEVVVLTDGLMQIGYVDGDFNADPLQGQGVGDHANSWAFDGFRCKKWNVSSYDYGEQWKADDVVGVLLDTERMEMSYFLNGKVLGVAFSDIPIITSSRMCPAASLNVNQSAEFNFGTLSVASSSKEGLPSSSLGSFKHLPVLDNEDQARLRPVLMALQTRRVSKAHGASNLDGPDQDESKENDASEDWSSSSSSNSGSDTDDGEFALEGSASLSSLRRTLASVSRDDRETRTTDRSDEEIAQRRRDLVDGLTGLGFPLEWATRCATEARLPMDETGAAAWILEQMEKVGLDGASRLPTSSSTNGAEVELTGQPAALWSTGLQLPNLVVSNSSDGLPTEASALAGASNLLNGIDSTPSELHDNVIYPSLSDKTGTTSATINAFIDADQGDQQSDDASSEAFQSGPYGQRQPSLHSGLQLSSELATSSETNSKCAMDDLLPLSIVVDATVFLAYTRQTFTSLLLLALREGGQEVAYRMTRRLVSSGESAARLHRFLRIAVGLDMTDRAFEMGYISENIHSERALRLQEAVAALLKFEARNSSIESGLTGNPSERSPLLRFFCQEMLSQCDRGLTLVRGKHSGKSGSKPIAVQAAAAWFAWVSGLVLGFVEDQVSGGSSTSNAIAETRLSDLSVPAFSSTAFVEKLVAIASSPSSTAQAWKYVAFKLLSRILCVVRAGDTSSEFFASAQLANLTQLFTLRRRRELYSRVFHSDVTNTLFALLVRSSDFLARDSDLGTQQCLERPRVRLRVSNYSSTYVTISWDQASTVLPSASSDSVSDEATTEPTAEVDSAPVFLHVTRCGSQLPGCVPVDSSCNNASQALPSKGTFTIRNLLPDTIYRIRLGPAPCMSDNTDGTTGVASNDASVLQGAETVVQTTPEPVFELDRETMGKNLVALNRNLTAKNTVNKKWHSVRASVAFEEGVHTWQVRLDACVSKNIFIGVCTADASMENYIGSDAYGYGFLANKAVWHNKAKLHSYGEIFKQGDTIQVTLDCTAKTLAFSRNGESLGIAASNIRAGTSRSDANGNASTDGDCKWYPAFSMYNKDDKVTLVPPRAASMFTAKEGRPQNATTFELIEAMQQVLAYQCHLTGGSTNLASTNLFEKAFEEFEGWRRGELLFREISLGQVIAIDKRKSATDKYGLATGDSVFTSKGQCAVLGEYRHELWYEVDEGSSILFGASTPQLASWSFSTCREMLDSPDEYPVHRHHKYSLELEDNAITETDSSVEQQAPLAGATESEVSSFQFFVDTQLQWNETGSSAAEADSKLIVELDAIAASQASSSALLLSFGDISTTLLMEKIVHGISAEHGSNQTLARIGLLLFVNRCLYNVVRLAMPRNIFATSLGTSEGPEWFANQPSAKQATSGGDTECQQVSPVAALLSSPHWAHEDPSTFTRIAGLAVRLLFSSQKEKLIEDELRRTKTASQTLDCQQEPSGSEDGGVDTDLPAVKIRYPLSLATPFWECGSALLTKKRNFRLPLSTESSVFAQMAKQLTAKDARQWRRESSQPFEAIPISQAFRVHVEKQSTESTEETGKDAELKKTDQQQQDEDDEDQQLQQPSSKQTAQYLKLFESAVREVQSPNFPLLAPVHTRAGTSEGERRHPPQLDINLELFAPSALAHLRVQTSHLLLWYFGFGQVLGIAWRSRLLLPLQFLSKSFWEELVSPADPLTEAEGGSGDRSRVREAVIRAIRDGLYSIIPSRCVALLNGSNPGLRERISDLDVSYVARLEQHATYTVPRQSHHDLFWKVVNAFTSVERRLLEQFVNPERRNGTKQVEATSGADNSSGFVLEIADALGDGRDHPDSCYPVVVPICLDSSRLHVPAYSSARTLRHKLLLAMTTIPFM